MNEKRCVLCGKSREQVKKLIIGIHGGVCLECIDLCNDIASGIEYFENCAADKIINLLASSKDPNIRMAVAENYNTPKKILKNFASDDDLDVRRSAHRDD